MLDLCVLLNGPPGVGKDTLADALVTLGFDKFMFKQGLYKETAEHFQVDVTALIARATDRTLKEQPWDKLKLYGKTISPRHAIIHVSEDVIKLTQGKSYFGDLAAKECIKEKTRFAVFSDSGFREETVSLINTFQKVIIVRLHRHGFDFSNDSRNYLRSFPHTYDLYLENNKQDEAVKRIQQFIMLERLPWVA